MNKLLKVGAVALMAIALVGCSAPEGSTRTSTDTGYMLAVDVQLPDGRQVTCVTNSKSLSCDWENAG